MNEYALIVAGGSGTRMQANVPKQFLLLHGKPILLWTIEAFYRYSKDIHIVVVLPENEVARWKEICQNLLVTIPHQVVVGGSTRFQSVKNGLKKIEDGLVAIHDGVRPFITPAFIQTLFSIAAQKQAVVPLLPVKESLRKITGETSQAENREHYRVVQTPQVFATEKIKHAYQTTAQQTYTDDASVAEASGITIYSVEGDERNIKITTPNDLKLAEWLFHSFSN